MRFHSLPQINVFLINWCLWCPQSYWQHLQKARKFHPQQRLLFICISIFWRDKFLDSSSVEQSSTNFREPAYTASFCQIELSLSCAIRLHWKKCLCAGWVQSGSSLGTDLNTISNMGCCLQLHLPETDKVHVAELLIQSSHCFHLQGNTCKAVYL